MSNFGRLGFSLEVDDPTGLVQDHAAMPAAQVPPGGMPTKTVTGAARSRAKRTALSSSKFINLSVVATTNVAPPGEVAASTPACPPRASTTDQTG